MHVLYALWLPIVLSSVFVFVVSAVIHMALPWHKSDYRPLPQEDKVLETLRSVGVPPGDYIAPRCETRAEMKTPEFRERLQKGPFVVATIMPGGSMQMGRGLVLWFLYLLAVSYLSAYVGWHALPAGSSYPRVFQIICTTAFLAYAGALWQNTIWFRKSWVATVKSTIDGLIYAGLTAGTFGWLWPR